MSEPTDFASYTPADLKSADPETLAKIALARTASKAYSIDGSYRTVGELLTDRKRLLFRQLFLSYHEDGIRQKSFSYRQFYRLARAWRDVMARDLGIETGSRVATLMVNDPRTVAIYFAAWMAGASIVPINCGEEDSRVAYILENSEAAACFCMPEQSERLAALAPGCPKLRHCITVDSIAPAGLADGGEGDPPEATVERAELSPHAEALIVYTSGTTGPPKGVVLDHGNLLADAQTLAEWHGFAPGDRTMNILPIHHVNGIIVTLLTPLISSGSIVLNRRFSASNFWKTMADERCARVSVVPTVLAFLCEQPDTPRDEYELSHLREILCGAGPLTCELARKFYDRFGVRIVHGYGLSETTCYSCFLPVDQSEDEYRHWMFECGFPSIGCPMPANEMAIHDAQGNVLGENERGEIVIRGANVMKYYFKRPDANRETFTHGWFRSGDEGFMQKGADGRDYYFITGRIKELIIRGGVNISPLDIDEVLCRCPGVRAAMAVGFENDFYGEEVGAYVQLQAGAETTSDELLAFAHSHLPYSKSPKVVVFGEEFPVTSTGKYQRNKLKPLFAEWKSAEFREKRA